MYTGLNDDTKLFTIGMGGKKIFDVPDADLVFIDGFLVRKNQIIIITFTDMICGRSSKGI